VADTAILFQSDIVFQGEPGFWFILALALSLLFLGWQYFRLRRVAPGKIRWVLMATRLLILAGIMMFLLKPTILRQKLATLKPVVAVLVDTSRSMSLPYDREGGLSRLEVAADLIRRVSQEETASSMDLEIFGFDEVTRPLNMEELHRAAAVGGESDILGALADMEDRRRSPSYSGILVLTDGRQNGGMDRYPGSLEPFLVGVGSRRPFRDLNLAEMRVAEIGFVKQPLTVTAVVRGEGFDRDEIPVSFKVDGRLVTVKKAVLAGEEPRELAFQWIPEKLGSHHLEVEIQPLPHEGVEDNNRRQRVVTVVRDRLRVLFISGSPSWNYRFLREALKNDPTIDLISFIILRSPYDAVDVPQNEMALIPFPTKRLFTEELETFDLVILDNFPFRPYLPVAYLTRLKDYIQEGGALWMSGGPMAFVNGGYRSTPVEEVLPFSLEGPLSSQGYLQQDFQVRFAAESITAPFFNLEESLIGGREALSRLPALPGFNVVGPARAGAVVLAEHPHQLSGGKPQPIIALRTYGEGRVLAVATDFLWSWNFTAAGEGLGNRLFLEFVDNVVRWLTRDPRLSPVRMGVTPESPAAGETVRVQVLVRDGHYRPVENASLGLSVHGPGETRAVLKALPVGDEGLYEASFMVPGEGGYRFKVEAAGPRGKLGETETLLQAAPPDEEMSSPGLDDDFLKGLAQGTGGRYLPFEEGEAFAAGLARAVTPKDRKYRLLGEERINLGSLPLTIALFLAALGADWSIRKRYHLE
jgi:uncharacterized membrane protein